MLNYANLNDVEFEALCRDVMERLLHVRLRRFAPGRDGGVDLTDSVTDKRVIVQVKHYPKSEIGVLVRSLKKELPKVQKLAPERYYICCSRELSHEKIRELFEYFRPYMTSDSQILTLLEIDDFLKKPENRDILQKHFKLWLDDTGILNELRNDAIFVDCEVFLSDADELCRLFVRTSAFDRAVKALEQESTLCIIGNPGVGKSMTSKMLAMYYAAQGYRVRYTTDVADLTGLKASLRRESDAKEIIVLDDCFGQAYFEMKASQGTELISLIKYVRLHGNKKLILNSRVTIFREAQQQQRELLRSLEREEFRVFILDMNDLSGEEKAKIFYNHLMFSGIPEAYFEQIRKRQRYRNIVFHRNYNPRLMEFVCGVNRYRRVAPEGFYDFILRQLDDPQEIWQEEYERRLQPADRILLQTVYSLTTTLAEVSLVRRCFERRIMELPTVDKTVDPFDASLKRLNESFLKLLDREGTGYLSVVNPSVNDFMSGRLTADNVEREELLRSICTVEQMRLLPEEERLAYGIQLLQSGEVDRFLFDRPEERTRFIARCVIAGELCLERYRPDVLEYIRMGRDFLVRLPLTFRSPMENLLLPELWEFYGLKAFLVQPGNLRALLEKMDLPRAVSLIAKMDGYFRDGTRAFYEGEVKAYLREASEEYCDVDASDYRDVSDAEDALRRTSYMAGDEICMDEGSAAADLEAEIAEEVFDSLERLFWRLPPPFSDMIDDMGISDIMVNGADSLVDAFLSDDPDVAEWESDGEEEQGYSAVDAVFQR